MNSFDFSLRSFRGFQEQSNVPIRPLTILVGENSAGKSSFLAGLKFMMDSFSGFDEPSFNKDPFQLGTFEQIAHYRGGKAGRAREFFLKINRNVSAVSLREQRGKVIEVLVPVEVTATFRNQESSASLSQLEIKMPDVSVLISLSGSGSIEFIHQGKSFKSEEHSYLLRYRGADGIRGVWYLLNELSYFYKIRNEGKNESDILLAFQNNAHLIENFVLSFRPRVVAGSPIRFKPLRTYTPGQEVVDSEGSHVPYEMAKLARKKSKTEWQNLQAEFKKYGTSSGMFNDLEVKSFGTTASDPFQLQFSYNGPKLNIADLGYGTSQVLPILYNVARAERGATFLIQQPEVHLHPKAQAALAQFFIEANRLRSVNFVLETHSDYILDRVRSAIGRGIISPEHVSLLFFERRRLDNIIHHIGIDEQGVVISPPGAYRKFFLDEQLRQLGILDADNN